MLQLTQDDIYLNQQADNKHDAIRKIASALTENHFVENGYVDGMLERESQAATYLGSGIAIPHGTTKTRHLVKKTGVQVFYFPNGVEWGDDGEKAYIAIGIAASSDEHLELLRQLTHVLGDEDIEDRIKQLKTKDDIIALLSGKTELQDENILSDDLLLLDIPVDSLDTLQALNASRLKRHDAVNTTFVANVLEQKPTYLGQGIWLNDCVEGNLKNAIAVSRVHTGFEQSGKMVNVLMTVSAKTDAINFILDNLAKLAYQQQLIQLHTADKNKFIQILSGDNDSKIPQEMNVNKDDTHDEQDTGIVTKEFTIVNPHGLHTRPGSVLVKVVKQFESKITVANLDGTAEPVSATSLMKIVALGAKKGSRLQFVAQGSDANQALDAIEQAINDGLGEGNGNG